MSDPGGLDQRRGRLRRDAGQCWVDVQTAVNTEDPEGLLAMGAPRDEYDSEIDDLVLLVRDESVTPAGVLTIWERWFGPHSNLARHPEVLQRLTMALKRISHTSDQKP